MSATVEIHQVEDKVVLLLDAPGGPPIVAVMTAREAHRLRSWLHKAANDAGAGGARQKAETA